LLHYLEESIPLLVDPRIDVLSRVKRRTRQTDSSDLRFEQSSGSLDRVLDARAECMHVGLARGERASIERGEQRIGRRDVERLRRCQLNTGENLPTLRLGELFPHVRGRQ